MADRRPQNGKKLRQPRWVRRPSRRADQIAICHGAINRDIGINAAGEFDFDAAVRIGRTGAPLQHAGACKELRRMTDCGDGLLGIEEVPHQLDQPFIGAKVFGSPAPRDHERVVS